MGFDTKSLITTGATAVGTAYGGPAGGAAAGAAANAVVPDKKPDEAAPGTATTPATDPAGGGGGITGAAKTGVMSGVTAGISSAVGNRVANAGYSPSQSGRDAGDRQRNYANKAYPGTSAWDQLGGAGAPQSSATASERAATSVAKINAKSADLVSARHLEGTKISTLGSENTRAHLDSETTLNTTKDKIAPDGYFAPIRKAIAEVASLFTSEPIDPYNSEVTSVIVLLGGGSIGIGGKLLLTGGSAAFKALSRGQVQSRVRQIFASAKRQGVGRHELNDAIRSGRAKVDRHGEIHITSRSQSKTPITTRKASSPTPAQKLKNKSRGPGN